MRPIRHADKDGSMIRERMLDLLEAMKLTKAKTGTHYKGTAVKKPGVSGGQGSEVRSANAAHYAKQDKLGKAKERAKARETKQGSKHKFHIRRNPAAMAQAAKGAKAAARDAAKGRPKPSYKAIRGGQHVKAGDRMEIVSRKKPGILGKK